MPSASSAASCTGWRSCPSAIPFCVPSQLCKSCAPRHPGIETGPGTDHDPTSSMSEHDRADKAARASGPATSQPGARRVAAPQPCRCRSAWAARRRARRSGRMRAPARQSPPARWLCSMQCPAPPTRVAAFPYDTRVCLKCTRGRHSGEAAHKASELWVVCAPHAWQQMARYRWVAQRGCMRQSRQACSMAGAVRVAPIR